MTLRYFFSSGSRVVSVLENTAQHFTSRLTCFFLKHKPKMLSQGLLSNNDRKPVVRQVIFCLRQCKLLSVKCSKETFSQPDSTGSQELAGTRPTVRHLIMSVHYMWLGKKFKELFQWTLGLEHFYINRHPLHRAVAVSMQAYAAIPASFLGDHWSGLIPGCF